MKRRLTFIVWDSRSSFGGRWYIRARKNRGIVATYQTRAQARNVAKALNG